MVEERMVALCDGAQLWTASTRAPGAAGLVLLHGGAGLWDYLEPVADMVADLVSTHRYDQRGCGRSSASDPQSLARAVDDLEELRSAFGYQRWAVFGHSFGAALAMAYAATHPESVSALVWCAGTGPDWPRHRAEHRARARARLSAEQARELDRLSALGRVVARGRRRSPGGRCAGCPTTPIPLTLLQRSPPSPRSP